MEITRTARDDQFELKLKGRMDAVWSDHVANALTASVRAGHHVIAVDMTEVDYISSAGIRILVLHSRQLKAIQGRLIIVRASRAVRDVLKLVGLDTLLHVGEDTTTVMAAAVSEKPVRQITLPQTGATAELFDLNPDATLRVQWFGNSAAWLEGTATQAGCENVAFAADTIGLGLGAFASRTDSEGAEFGEFLGAGGAVVCQPADGSNKPDYMLLQGALTPTVKLAYGILGRGSFARLLRFDKGPEQPSLTLSTVVQACLDAAKTDAAGIVMLAETASLAGASLQKAPASSPVGTGARNIFAFPEVREWLSFTAEAAFANSVSLIVGFAATGSRALNPNLLKPLVSSGEIYGHFHAAAFPYRPLRKGKVNLTESLQPLFEGEHVLGVLHLLNDWRNTNGAGESCFFRGACWCAPLVT